MDLFSFTGQFPEGCHMTKHSKIGYGNFFKPEETHHSLCQLIPIAFLCVSIWIQENTIC